MATWTLFATTISVVLAHPTTRTTASPEAAHALAAGATQPPPQAPAARAAKPSRATLFYIGAAIGVLVAVAISVAGVRARRRRRKQIELEDVEASGL